MHTITTAAPLLRSEQLSPRQLVEQCLRTIERLEPKLRAWVSIDAQGALRAADQLGAELRSGHDRGALHGIPVGIKDIVDVDGWPTRAGSPWYGAQPASVDAPVVARLREAGAIVLGKTVTTEFAGFDPSPTRNPWNLQHTPGGSSSGSAAAVAVGMCLAAIGTQTGGSILRPASFCGIAGFKPAHGRVPLTGIVPISAHLDHPGPMARCVSDLRHVYRAIRDPEPSAEPLSGAPRCGIVETYFFAEAAPDVVRVVRAALDRLAQAGATLVPVTLPESFANVHRLHRRIMAHDYAQGHRETFPRHREQYGVHVSRMIVDGSDVTPAEYAEALEHQRRFQADMHAALSSCDVWLMPSTVTTAPGLETTGDPRFQSPWSYAGVPSVTIPCGCGDGGLPVGLQLVARRDGGERVLDVAQWCEARLDPPASPELA